MADRIFASFAFLIVLGYGFIAFTGIKAPFQYDPLGPESWPRLLSVVAGLCCLWVLVRPEVQHFDLGRSAGTKIAATVLALIVYAALFEPAGFIIATALFCAPMSRLLGATTSKAILFGVSTGIIGYVVGVKLLELNLPAGLLSAIL